VCWTCSLLSGVRGDSGLAPALVLTGGEHLTQAARQRMQLAFHAPVRDSYGASEFLGMAYDCGKGWLHCMPTGQFLSQ
jgi:phenylacetate-CoA ligase